MRRRWARSGPRSSRRNETRDEIERDRRRDFASDSMSEGSFAPFLSAGVRLILSSTGIFSSLLLCLLSSEREPNCRDTGFNMPVAEFSPIIVSCEIAHYFVKKIKYSSYFSTLLQLCHGIVLFCLDCNKIILRFIQF